MPGGRSYEPGSDAVAKINDGTTVLIPFAETKTAQNPGNLTAPAVLKKMTDTNCPSFFIGPL